MNDYKGLIFDLDGVIVDTAKYHYIAWRELADGLGISFTKEDNERLKGVSRMASFEIILEIGGRTMSEQEKEENCRKKNDIYVSYIQKITQDELLPGVKEFMADAKAKGFKISLGSASRNSSLILDRLGITGLFDAVIDGTKVSRAKPDPEVFLKGAGELKIPAPECIVFEDAVAGVEAAHNAGMKAVGVGSKSILAEADAIIDGFREITIDDIVRQI